MNISIIIFLFITGQFLAGDPSGESAPATFRRIEYNLEIPDRIYNLPAFLHEISGITEVDATSVACVQDEHGIVFIYDLSKNQVSRQIAFAAEGDYEGIARVNETLYVLRSDEAIIEINNFRSNRFTRASFDAALPGRDFEGLCYDKKNNRLLVAPKEISDDNPGNKGKRFIYAFDLAAKKVAKGPVWSFDISSIESFALENKIKIPMKGKKGEVEKPDINMGISAIAIHPFNNRLYAISGAERLLFVFNINGDIEFLERLDKDRFPQPEGITFMNNGDMLISNESAKGFPTIVRFKYDPKTVTKP